LTLVGRISDFVNVAGRKVHPAEVERVIAEMADVVHVWVIGITSGARGQDLVACVQRRGPNLSAAAVRTHCAATLSPHKVPRRVIFADQLPLTARGKISHHALEALLQNPDRRTDGL
jgi:long-chain acyl-CoA synthetase